MLPLLVTVLSSIFVDSETLPSPKLVLTYSCIYISGSALIKTRYALQYNTRNNSQGSGLGATAHTQPP